ncbi:hypothetical protein BH20ACT10_BH20ACT10_00610 [soil metagenome]
MAIRRGAGAGGEQPQRVVEAGGDLGRRHAPHPRRGELDGERRPFEPPAHFRDRRGVRLHDLEAGRGGGSPLREEPRRLRARSRLQRRGVRHGHGRNRPYSFTRNSERLAARGENREVRASAEQPLRQPRARLDEMLAVVEEDQAPPVSQSRRKLALHLSSGALPDAKHGGRLPRDERRIPQRIQLHQPDPVRECTPGNSRQTFVAREAPRRLQREPGFAGAADPGEREKSARTDHAPHLIEFRLAPDEARQRKREVAVGAAFRRNHAQAARLRIGAALPLAVWIPSNTSSSPRSPR